MPYSYGYFKNQVKYHLISTFSGDTKVLDVGCGCGTYGKLLREFFEIIDGIEVYDAYIKEFSLDTLYNKVYNENALNFDKYEEYELIIAGDIIEHMSIEDASNFIKKINNFGKRLLVAVPYKMKQNAVGGNTYEVHLQDDLTHEIFLERYPCMNLLFSNEEYGYYINYT